MKIHTRNMPLMGSFHNNVALKVLSESLEVNLKIPRIQKRVRFQRIKI